MTDEPFRLATQPQRRASAKFDDVPTEQHRMFAGMDALPGQNDLPFKETIMDDEEVEPIDDEDDEEEEEEEEEYGGESEDEEDDDEEEAYRRETIQSRAGNQAATTEPHEILRHPNPW